MLNPVLVLLKSRPSVVRWVNEDALDFASKFLFEGFEGEKVVAEYKAVVEEVMVSNAMNCVIRFLRILQQDARLQLGPVLLANPRQFKFSVLLIH
jgi:hypothetical protein